MVNTDTDRITAVLLRAAEILEPEGAWTRGYYARNKGGAFTDHLSISACSWCLEGALSRAAVELETSPQDDLYVSARARLIPLTGFSLVKFNDAPDRTQAEVVATLRATAAAQPRPPADRGTGTEGVLC